MLKLALMTIPRPVRIKPGEVLSLNVKEHFYRISVSSLIRSRVNLSGLKYKSRLAAPMIAVPMIAVPRSDEEQRSVSFTIHGLDIIRENGTAFRQRKAGVISPASIAKDKFLSTEVGHTAPHPR